jgi:hypothetical protein
MKRWIVLMLVLGIAFVGCTKQEEAVESAKEAVGSAKEAVGSAKEAVESAKEAVTGETGEEERLEKGCLQLVSEAKFEDALPMCLAALKNDPTNDEVKAAAEKAQAAVGDAAAAATDAAQGAQEAAEEQVQGAVDEAQDAQKAAEEQAKGAVDKAVGGLPQ